MGGYRRAGDFLFKGRNVRSRRRAGDLDWEGTLDEASGGSTDTDLGTPDFSDVQGGSSTWADLSDIGAQTAAASAFPLALPDIGGGIQRLLGGGAGAAAVGSAAAAGMSSAVPSSIPKTVK